MYMAMSLFLQQQKTQQESQQTRVPILLTSLWTHATFLPQYGEW